MPPRWAPKCFLSLCFLYLLFDYCFAFFFFINYLFWSLFVEILVFLTPPLFFIIIIYTYLPYSLHRLEEGIYICIYVKDPFSIQYFPILNLFFLWQAVLGFNFTSVVLIIVSFGISLFSLSLSVHSRIHTWNLSQHNILWPTVSSWLASGQCMGFPSLQGSWVPCLLALGALASCDLSWVSQHAVLQGFALDPGDFCIGFLHWIVGWAPRIQQLGRVPKLMQD